MRLIRFWEMNQRNGFCFVVILLLCSFSSSQSQHETVLDEIVTIYDKIIYDIPYVSRWCDRLGFEGQMISVAGARLYAETEGLGIPLVLLHGGPGATHHYFHPHFTRAAEFAYVIYYDQRGCGLSDYEPGGGYSIQQAAKDLDNLREALGLDEWVVLGHSYGGLLAQVYAIKYSENIAGLVLVNSPVSLNINLEPTRQYDFLSDDEISRMQELRNMSDLSREQILYNRHLNGDWKRQSYYRPSEEQLAEMVFYEWVSDPFLNSSVMRSAVQLDLDEVFLSCRIPTLIIEGEWDLTWNTDKPGILHAQHPNADMIILEHSGHNPFEDEPAAFFSELERFISMLD